jgi:hypothetical protein
MARRVDRAKFEDWRRRLARFRSSELTVADFCRREEVSLASYYYWSRRLGESQSSAVAPPKRSGHAPIDKPSLSEGARSAIEISLPGGVRVLVPADCTEALPLVLQSALRLDASSPGGQRAPAFQQVLLESHA